jgi:hypothetical protein
MKVLLDHGSDKYAEGETWKKLKNNVHFLKKEMTYISSVKVSTCTGMKANSLMDVIQVILANTIGDELPPGSPPTRTFTL